MLKLLSEIMSVFSAFIPRCTTFKSRRSRRSPYMFSTETLEVRVLLSSVYVSTTGNDQSSGSANSPWQTLQYAADHVQPGDQLSVSAGNYTGFDLTTSGTAANRITFHGEAGATINAGPWMFVLPSYFAGWFHRRQSASACLGQNNSIHSGN